MTCPNCQAELLQSPNKSAVCIQCGYVAPAAAVLTEMAKTSGGAGPVVNPPAAAGSSKARAETSNSVANLVMPAVSGTDPIAAGIAPSAGAVVVPPPGSKPVIEAPMTVPDIEAETSEDPQLRLVDAPRAAKEFAGDLRSETTELLNSKEGQIIQLVLKAVGIFMVIGIVLIFLIVFVLQ